MISKISTVNSVIYLTALPAHHLIASQRHGVWDVVSTSLGFYQELCSFLPKKIIVSVRNHWRVVGPRPPKKRPVHERLKFGGPLGR